MESDNCSSRQSLLNILSTSQADQVLTPISMIQLINIEDTYESILNMIKKDSCLCYPVYQDGIDDIIGILSISDLLLLEKNNSFNLRSLLSPPVFISENVSLLEVWEKFTQKKCNIILVVDEYGSIRGVIRESDIISGLIEVHESKESLDKLIIEKNGKFLVDARLSLEEFNNKFHTQFTCLDYDSIGGYVIENFTYVPQLGEELSLDTLIITVSKIEGAKLKELIVELK